MIRAILLLTLLGGALSAEELDPNELIFEEEGEYEEEQIEGILSI